LIETNLEPDVMRQVDWVGLKYQYNHIIRPLGPNNMCKKFEANCQPVKKIIGGIS